MVVHASIHIWPLSKEAWYIKQIHGSTVSHCRASASLKCLMPNVSAADILQQFHAKAIRKRLYFIFADLFVWVGPDMVEKVPR